MTTEQVETNGTQTQEPAKVTTTAKPRTRTTKPKEDNQMTALSVKEKTIHIHGAHGIELIVEEGNLPGNRPIEASHLKVISTYTSVGGNRPVTASGMDITGTLTISGQRPIMASHLQVSETYAVMGNRPVAPNEIDDPETLMGFLD
ncbi:conserved hypothetical protein [Rippkaea orientalis PCC 8801]|uniref:Uncharacterized protein n=1 Tax=Rippkaea orientalis (strain PCC 8801 / RF-1) TaxID=41431 RepID=B7K2T1_RIPO1|nr:hypothetical protein [Rippkaea orientalis]ACK67632.1 conserved hypothetical protein [Rippkaea orientalis PCC 8801]